MKKFSIILCSALAVCSLAMFSCQRDTDDEEDEKGENQVENVEIAATSSVEMAKNVAIGWNLGNTLDATGAKDLTSETSWGQPMTTKAMIDGIAAAGFKTIRLPVSWHNHITNTENYTIDSAWISRVKEVVDWAYNDGLYIILNVHHDNLKVSEMSSKCGYALSSDSEIQTKSKAFLEAVWTQIATNFASYGDRLIFEVLNEPRDVGGECWGNEWWCNNSVAYTCITDYEQTCLDAIRAVRGNENRYLMCPGYAGSGSDSTELGLYTMPTDTASDRLILSARAYSPYGFAMYDGSEHTEFTSSDKSYLDSMFAYLNTNYVQKGIGVIIGETSATNKDNLSAREEWASYFFAGAWKYGMPCVLWDNGAYEAKVDDSERHGYYKRTDQTWYFPTMISKAMSSVGVTAGTLNQAN